MGDDIQSFHLEIKIKEDINRFTLSRRLNDLLAKENKIRAQSLRPFENSNMDVGNTVKYTYLLRGAQEIDIKTATDLIRDINQNDFDIISISKLTKWNEIT